MRIHVRAPDVGTEELQQAVDGAWTAFMRSDLSGYPEFASLSEDVRGGSGAFEVSAEREGFGVVELILIAAAGRLVATIPERVLVRFFDDVIWPKLQNRFGGSVSRVRDEQE